MVQDPQHAFGVVAMPARAVQVLEQGPFPLDILVVHLIRQHPQGLPVLEQRSLQTKLALVSKLPLKHFVFASELTRVFSSRGR